MDKVLFVGVGHVGSKFVKKVNEEQDKINLEKGPQVNSICFLPAIPNEEERPKVAYFCLNDMDEEHGNGYTSRHSAQEYREVAEKLEDDIRLILQNN